MLNTLAPCSIGDLCFASRREARRKGPFDVVGVQKIQQISVSTLQLEIQRAVLQPSVFPWTIYRRFRKGCGWPLCAKRRRGCGRLPEDPAMMSLLWVAMEGLSE